jgi:hypothetical protein
VENGFLAYRALPRFLNACKCGILNEEFSRDFLGLLAYFILAG